MPVIDIDQGVYDHLLRNAQVIGESASSILRRLLDLPPECEPQHMPREPRREIDQAMHTFLQSPDFQAAGTATRQYLAILGHAHEQQPEAFARLLSITFGRSRVYFAHTES